MYKNIAILLSVLFLSGCYTAQQLGTQIETQAQMEGDAWMRLEEMYPSVCGISTDPNYVIPRNEAMEKSLCMTQLVEQEVIPYALYPDLVREFRRKQEFLSGQYADGKLSDNERKYANHLVYEEYLSAIDARAMQSLQAQQEYDLQQINSFNNALQSATDSFRPTPVTNCTRTYQGVRCAQSAY